MSVESSLDAGGPIPPVSQGPVTPLHPPSLLSRFSFSEAQIFNWSAWSVLLAGAFGTILLPFAFGPVGPPLWLPFGLLAVAATCSVVCWVTRKSVAH